MNKKAKNILVVFGTRPEVIKLAPVIIELKKYPEKYNVIVCNTEQQKELSNQTLSYFDLKADINLDCMRPNQSLAEIQSRVLKELDKVFDKFEIDATIVQGDTMTVLCGALASFYRKIPVFHVEAGLRSYDIFEPFPEEVMRQMTSRVADLHFAPTGVNKEALLKEMTLSVEKEIIAKNYLKSELTDQDIKDYYDSNVFGKYTAKHILITPKTTDGMSDEEKAAAEEAAKTTATKVISKLNNGEDWKSLVAQYSEDTGSKDNEGLIEDFTKGDVVDEFWNDVEGLKDNEYTTEPVKSSYGYHIIYRVSYTEKESLKNMKNDLVDEIVTNKLSEDTNLFTTTWTNIRKKYKLVINDTVVKSKYDTTTNKSE